MAYSDNVVAAESGGNPNSTNANSSASGPAGFIDSTWLDMLAKHRPDIAGSRDDLLALKTDPVLSKQMADAYGNDNGAILASAGAPVTDGTKYLAHFAGPHGAIGILNSDPTASAASILGPAVLKANPFLANMSAGDLTAWANRKGGGNGPTAPMSIAGPQTASQPPAAAPPTSPAPAQQAQQAPFSPASGANLAAIAAMPQLQNILPARPNVLLGGRAPFSLRG